MHACILHVLSVRLTRVVTKYFSQSNRAICVLVVFVDPSLFLKKNNLVGCIFVKEEQAYQRKKHFFCGTAEFVPDLFKND